jgi:hypothetical protein
VVEQCLDEDGAPIDEDITTNGLLQRRDVSRHVAKDMAIVPLHFLQASGYDIFGHPVDGFGEPGVGLARPVRGERFVRGFAQQQRIHAGKLINLVLPRFWRAVFKLPAAMRMRGFIAAWRLDNTVEGDEFGNDNFSHGFLF